LETQESIKRENNHSCSFHHKIIISIWWCVSSITTSSYKTFFTEMLNLLETNFIGYHIRFRVASFSTQTSMSRMQPQSWFWTSVSWIWDKFHFTWGHPMISFQVIMWKPHMPLLLNKRKLVQQLVCYPNV
jgi:hypothetical protein